MKLQRAVHHVATLAEACAGAAERPRTIFPLRVEQLWVWGEVLDGPPDLEAVDVALGVDLPDVAWRSEPKGAQHWSDATRLSRVPLRGTWRSTRAPVWNHAVVRPVLVWDVAAGPREEALADLAQGRAQAHRLPAPAPEELAERMDQERRLSLAHLEAATRTYEQRRWSPGRLEPHADALALAAAGYLDVLRA